MRHGNREYIKKRIKEYLIHHLDAIHYEQSGKTPGQTPLIEVWCKIVKGTRRFLGPEHSKLMKRQFDSFAAFQVSLLSMALEYYAAEGYSEQYIENHIVKQFAENMEEQFKILPLTIPKETIVETNSGMMITPYRIWDPPYDNGITKDKQIKIGLALDNCSHYSSINFMGFSDWRPPRPGEVGDMFYGSPGKSLATWAISKGYPKDYLKNNVVVLLKDAHNPWNPAETYWTYTYRYYLVNGTISGVNQCYKGERKPGGGKKYHWTNCLGSWTKPLRGRQFR